ncbi:V-set and immunoglobulin domain-containing protein 10-like [Megalops cyprinoides]|uniref:V-set and immunoglobulin domain-containing protein 10-like n=1 Tax=Megalops cyprinoides TaxID=118141 RepID=UPI00186414E3|nr:V-set and immunoglobulin domain-containing protein 10-like [Megalops cyprinoides]
MHRGRRRKATYRNNASQDPVKSTESLSSFTSSLMESVALISVILALLTGCCAGQNVLPPGPVNGAVGGNVTFTTTIDPSTSTQFIVITWTFRTASASVTVITSSPGGEVPGPGYEGRVSVNRITGSLELRQLTVGDAGGYTVQLTPNGDAPLNGETTLGVYEPVSSVTVTANGTDLVEFNDTVSLTCSASGTSLSFRWHNGSSDIITSDRIHLSDNNRTLTVSSVLRSDSGSLSCTVSNVISKATSRLVILNISSFEYLLCLNNDM